ncbi:MAG: ATP--guanido phosphotransferase [Planctomycetes bacterium]|nr:ATP--guanido phosphotransferase [Planctomycetota bacterium]
MTTVGDIVGQPCAWLQSPGDHDGIVVSSRIRLARNVAGYAFHRKLSRQRQQELVDELIAAIARATDWKDPLVAQVPRLSDAERQALVERQLISRDLAGGKSPAGVYVSRDEIHSLMLNEEDHVRLQVIQSGFSLHHNLARAVALDRALERELEWSYHPTLGYLTACHTNVGTGMRASIMLHLPALAETGELKQVLRALTKLHMTVRGQHGEGSEANGHYYQVSNMRSLGVDEATVVESITECAQKIVSAEQLARQALLDKGRVRLEDRVHRAWGVLTNARSIDTAELNEQMSWLRLGVALHVLDIPKWAVLDKILLQCQPAHLQLLHSHAEDPTERDPLRANLVRTWLSMN